MKGAVSSGAVRGGHAAGREAPETFSGAADDIVARFLDRTRWVESKARADSLVPARTRRTDG